MAIIEQPVGAGLAIPEGSTARKVATPRTSYGVFKRPVATSGWRDWVVTVDHKKLGIMYGIVAFTFFIVGGCEALLIRAQLFQPNGKVLNADQYNHCLLYTSDAADD